MEKQIVFVGAGAVGCFYASRLHSPQHGIHVSLIARSNFDAINELGVRLHTHSFGDYIFKPDTVFSSIDSAALRSWDYVILTTKALPDSVDEPATIAPLIKPETCIVLIQNGVGVEAPFRAKFPDTPIVSAVTQVSAEQTAPGIVKQNRWTRLSLGPYTGGDASTSLLHRTMNAVEHLCHIWGPGLGGIRDIESYDEAGLQLVRWHKLLVNAAMNPSAVLSGGLGNADMVADTELRRHLMAVMTEILNAIPHVVGRPLPPGLATPEQIILSTERNKGAKPSMLLDWEAGRPLELEVILGNPLRVAREKGIELPRAQTLYALLNSAQRLRRRENKL